MEGSRRRNYRDFLEEERAPDFPEENSPHDYLEEDSVPESPEENSAEEDSSVPDYLDANKVPDFPEDNAVPEFQERNAVANFQEGNAVPYSPDGNAVPYYGGDNAVPYYGDENATYEHRLELERAQLIKTFQATTRVSVEVARLKLEMVGWIYQMAIKNHYGEEPELYEIPIVEGSRALPRSYEDSEEEVEQAENLSTHEGKTVEQPENLSVHEGKTVEQPENLSVFGNKRKDRAESPSMNENAKRKETNQGPSNRIVTISSLSEDQDNTGQAFYAGGSVHSGQQVLDPSTRGLRELIQEMMMSAESHGAVVVQGKKDSTSNTKPFQGPGHVLGYGSGNDADDESTFDTAMDVEKEESDRSDNSEPDPSKVVKIYNNGIIINGQFHGFDDEKTSEFVAALTMGQMPGFKQKEKPNVTIEDHIQELYGVPHVVPFSGIGYRLGSPTPNPSATLDQKIEKPLDEKETSGNEKQLVVDENLPCTTIQIRLADGSRMNMTFNLSHTIQDIFDQIVLMNPEYAHIPFDLLNGFPPRLLVNLSSTIEEEKLHQSVLIMKRKEDE